MIEYLFDAIRATAGEDITIAAIIEDENGAPVADICSIMLHDDNELLISAIGAYNGEMWEFTIPATATTGLKGRYWYCICAGSKKLCFKQPIYLV